MFNFKNSTLDGVTLYFYIMMLLIINQMQIVLCHILYQNPDSSRLVSLYTSSAFYDRFVRVRNFRLLIVKQNRKLIEIGIVFYRNTTAMLLASLKGLVFA